ncbi:TPA: NTP transferase domain-containing protein, partial [Yersinia enterocolitica]|nr:NTP transferase domain-containing protein [Yersinia enterocolitica]
MLTEAIILAGGLGTRLRSVSGEKPKPIIEVAGRPFIYYILDGLISQNITRVV